MFLPSNVSTNKLASPTNVEGATAGLMIDVPVTAGVQYDYQKRFALVTSLLVCNKTASNIGVFAKVTNGSTTAYILNGLNLPPNISYDIISGNKITLKEGDKLYVWHDSSAVNSLDALLSYTLHTPLTTYDI
jgi:hypothetical protein